MTKKVTGTVSQFGSKGYGFIDGDDGQRYFVHQKNINTQLRLKPDTRVVFSAESSEKGLVAMQVRLENDTTSELKPLSDDVIKALFSVLFISQLAVLYQVFFST